VVKEIKRHVRPMKVGHTGTLDPMATGLLPLTIGEATKLTHCLSRGDKRYLARIRLGSSTDTLDAEGTLLAQASVPDLNRKSIEKVLSRFVGQIEQIPPMYSALHHQGQRLYSLARKGIEVERKPRKVLISSLTLVAYDNDLVVDVTCSAGTYIRSLAADIGDSLGTLAHLAALERTEACGFYLQDASELLDITRSNLAERILGLDQVLARFRRIDVSAEIAKKLAQGMRLRAEQLAELGIQHQASETVWFRHPEAQPIILSVVFPEDSQAPMKILRVLKASQLPERCECQKQKKNKA
jgi:tRNA pseudouridine55 synthase